LNQQFVGSDSSRHVRQPHRFHPTQHICRTMSEDDDLQTVRYHATRFRNAIDSARRDDWKGNMKGFPVECCHHACTLLLLYFKRIGMEGFRTYSGIHPTNQGGRHLWLQKGEIVIDITADQFPEIDKKVIVTRESSWHDSLGRKVHPSPTNPNYDSEIWEWYAEIYLNIEAILAKMP
jgi:hypothetical protein